MRAWIAVIGIASVAHAEPEDALHEQAVIEKRGAAVTVDAATGGDKPSIGAGVAVRYATGSYAVSLGLMRWQVIDQPEHSWDLSLRGYRYIGHSYFVGGLDYERVTYHDDSPDVATFGRVSARIGAGTSWRVGDSHASLELTLEARHWLDPPVGVENDNEFRVMLMFGFTF
jgi:hypothetical protein